MAWERIVDSPIAALATGLIIASEDGEEKPFVIIQADHVQIVILDVASAREFAEGILTVLPIVEGGVVPETFGDDGVPVADDSLKRIRQSVESTRTKLGLGPQQHGG